MNPLNGTYVREIGCLYFLLGNHAKASEIFLDAIKLNDKDWVSSFRPFKELEEHFSLQFCIRMKLL